MTPIKWRAASRGGRRRRRTALVAHRLTHGLPFFGRHLAVLVRIHPVEARQRAGDDRIDNVPAVRQHPRANALRRRPHSTHFNLEQAVDAVRRMGATRALFTHISHDMAHAETCATLPAGMQLAYDGQVIEIDD